MAEAKTPAKKTKTTTRKTPAKKASTPVSNKEEAKSRFTAALDEAKAGAAALRAEAGERAGAYRDSAKTRGNDMMAEAKNYGAEAKVKAGELATEGKNRVSDGLSSLGRVMGDTATQIDEKFGEQYGDYARTASRNLQEASAKLEAKSVEDLGEDAREFVRKSPGMAVGIAAIAGFMLARMFRGGRD